METYFQDAKIPPVQAAQQIGILEAYTEAKETGTDIKVPLSTWAEKVVGTEHYAGLADDIKFDPGQNSVNEQKKTDEEAKAQMADLAKTQQEESVSKIRDSVRSQLIESGTLPKDADKQVALYESAFRSVGERTGQDPLKLFEKYALKIGRPEFMSSVTQNEQVLNQPARIEDQLQQKVPIPEQIKRVQIPTDSSFDNLGEKEIRDIALNEAKSASPQPTVNVHTGERITLSKEGLKKSANMAVRPEQAIALRNLPELLTNAIYLRSEKNRESPKSLASFDYYYSPFVHDGKSYIAKFVVKKSAQGNNFYSLHTQEMKSPSGEAATITPGVEAIAGSGPDGSAISKADLFSQVNEARETTTLFQSATNAPPFYSKLQKTIDEKMGNAATVEQVRAIARDLKPEEVEWSGLNEFLQGKEKVSKPELLDFLRANQLQIKEVTKGQAGTRPLQVSDVFEATEEKPGEWFVAARGYDLNVMAPTREEAMQKAVTFWNNNLGGEELPQNENTTKFSKYTLPGGENYREVLFTLPEVKEPVTKLPDYYRIYSQESSLQFGDQPKGTTWFVSDTREAGGNVIASGLTEEQATQNALDKLSARKSQRQDNYNSSHFDEPNILAHARVNDRVDSDGKKVLFIEEVQSDWHQQGRKAGYKGSNDQLPVNTIVAETPDGKFVVQEKADGFVDMDSIAPTADEAIRRYNAKRDRSVPNAPFKKTWQEFVLKRMIREAAEKDYDKIAWTTGEQQAERYDLSKEVETVQYYKNPEGKYSLKILDYEGNDLGPGKNLNSDELESVVGKELAEKIISEKGKASKKNSLGQVSRTLSGVDLKVGGEGMKGFYDKILVDAANKLTKKFGARVESSKVEAGNEGTVPGDYSIEASESYPGKFFVTDNADGEMVGDHFDSRDAAEAYKEKIAQQFSKPTYDKVHSLELTPELKRTALEEGFSLFQKDEAGGPRGQIRFGNNRQFNIDLLKNADMSTFLHESGHFFLEVMSDVAGSDKATDQIKADYAAIREYLGAKEGEAFTTEQHEKWARSFEAYLMEGKAPSSALQKAFQHFKVWLTNIYRQVKGLNVELTPEVRGVFDRLLATEDEIAAAEVKQNMDPLFPDPIAFGMSESQAKRYIAARDEARAASEQELQDKILEDVRKKKEREYREKRAVVRTGITQAVNERNVYKAIETLRGEVQLLGTDQELKLSKVGLDKETLKKLPRGIVAKEGGLEANLLAEFLNFESGESMLKQLTEAPPKKELIDQMTDEQMKELYPELLDSPTLPNEAMKSIHNEKRAQLLRMELEHLASNNLPALKDVIRKVARRVPTERAVRDQAARIIGGKNIQEIRPYIFERAEAKAAKQAGELLAKGDIAGAFEAKRIELLNHELYRASVTANDEISKSMEFVKRLNRKDEDVAKSRDIDLVNAARALLAQYGLGKADKEPEQYLKSLKNYAPEQYETMKALIEDITEKKGNYKDLNYKDFTQVKDAVEALWSLARSQKQIEIDGKKMEKASAVEQLIASAQKIMSPKAMGQYRRTASNWDKTTMTLLSFKAALTRVEHWVDAIELGKINGPFRKFIFTPISEAADRFKSDKAKYVNEFKKLLEPIEKTLTNKPIQAAEIGFEFRNKAQLLGAMLHTGNNSNKSKLLRGYGWGLMDLEGNLETERWDAFIKRAQNEGILTKADYDFLQATWNLTDKFKAGAQAVHKQLYGTYFNEVTADAFETPWGNYQGGYMPAKADPNQYTRAQILEDKEIMEGLNNSWAWPTTGRGSTMSRVEAFAAPLQIELQMVPNHLDWALRFIHLQPAVSNVAKIVNDKAFASTLDSIDSNLIEGMITPWLQRAAQQKTSTPLQSKFGRGLDAVGRFLRTRTAAQYIAFSVTNAVQNLANIGPILLKVKGKYLRNALVEYMKSPKEFTASIAGKSEMMDNRLSDTLVIAQDHINDLVLNPNKFDKTNEFLKKHSYILSKFTQNIMDTVTWTGAYDQGIEKGLTEKEAVREANSIVRLTQSSGSPEDISRMEAGPDAIKPLFMFANFWNNLANLNAAEYVKTIRQLGLKKGAPRLVYVYTMGFMSVAVISELMVKALAGKLDEDDDGEYLDDLLSIFFDSQARQLGAMVPLLGPTMMAGFSRFNDKAYDDSIKVSPAISALESAMSTPYDVAQVLSGKDLKKKDVRDVLTLLGFLTGAPTAPIARPLGYLMDVSRGDAEPSGPIDFTRGLVTGKTGK
jgi:hypothetical protein